MSAHPIEHSPKRRRVGASVRAVAGCTIMLLLASLIGSARADGKSQSTKIYFGVSVDSGEGRVLCALYDRKGWLKQRIKGVIGVIKDGSATCRFEGVKPGTYAISAFQDENLNGELDRNWLGIPSEPWCASRDARGSFGPPDFEDARITVGSSELRLSCPAR